MKEDGGIMTTRSNQQGRHLCRKGKSERSELKSEKKTKIKRLSVDFQDEERCSRMYTGNIIFGYKEDRNITNSKVY